MVKTINRKRNEGGILEILKIAIPLIFSTGAHGLLMFVDRTFLMWYDNNAISASMQAGMVAFTFLSLFQGTASYVNTFVAQYTGAKQYDQIGHAIWQSIYLSCFAAVIMICLIPFSSRIFSIIGHAEQTQIFEVQYFNIMCINALPALCAISLSNFFTGRGKTQLVMYITFVTTLTNAALDYIMIFGKLGLPAMGVSGAAWATVISTTLALVLYCTFFVKRKYREKFSTLKGIGFDAKLFWRIIRFGLPSGLEFMLMMISWTTFVALSGKIDINAFNATAVTCQIDMLSFMPMIGIGIAVSTLVGQRLGQNRPDIASRTTYSAFIMSFAYCAIISIGYITVPDIFLLPFASNSDPVNFAVIKPIIVSLLWVVCLKNIFEPGNIIFASSIRGAGDTKFVMIASVAAIWATVTIPGMIAVKLGAGVVVLWSLIIVHKFVSFSVFFIRFLQGKWKNMRVIEQTAAVVVSPSQPPETEINPYIRQNSQ